MVDALTVESDEGRGKTAISFGEMSNIIITRRFPNGETS